MGGIRYERKGRETWTTNSRCVRNGGGGSRRMFCISDVYRGVATAVAWCVGMQDA